VNDDPTIDSGMGHADVDSARDEIRRLAEDRGSAAAAQSLTSLTGIARQYRCRWLLDMAPPSESVLADRAVAQACEDFRAGVRVR